ncbi:PREDICTED: uncharacterized protein LOC104753624 [Camelina sativa]|uniref:Uncharacterized protein LOC104753624 n=1 Tax=Camelina sativa TaxID=90675 RepID=A0ABM0WPG0_CAMSA|nr:PREDICTED: uncharacterized protein LOC104753624 [Camelina sativa]
MDLILEEEERMYSAIQEVYGVNTNREMQRTYRGGGWRRVQRFMYESEKQCFDILRMNQDTVKRKLDDVLGFLLKLAAYIVKPSRGEFTKPSPKLVKDGRYWPFFENCIGALDGTHISVRPPYNSAEAYRGRKSVATINVLAICNFSMRFIFAYVGVPGRAHDTKVLTHCATHEPSFPHPPNGKYYLVDSGYPTRTGYLGPHRRARYHLDLFARGGPPISTRELFNPKWRILDRKHPKYEVKKWIKIVTATMTLHNFIRDSHYEDHDFAYWEGVDDYENHGDQAVENEEEDNIEHTPYIPIGETLRDVITEKIGRGRQLPY